MTHIVYVTLLAAALITGPAAAATEGTSKEAGAPSMQLTDRDFVSKAAAAGMAEVEAGRLAADKALSDDVKQFAQMMVDDHSKANERLKAIASEKNLTLPQQPAEAERKKLDAMKAMSGLEFDRAYLKQQVEAHEQAVALFSKQAKSGKDAELKKFAEETLPKLQQHQKRVQELQKTTAKQSTYGGSVTPAKPAE